MFDEQPFTFRVADLKQYAYCPRILYYQTVLPAVRPTTYKMEAGIAAQGQAEGREKRRSLRSYGLESGERTYNVPLYSPALRLSGELDMLIETDEALIPVDYKNARLAGDHFRLQMTAYALLLEAARPDKPVTHGFLYLIPLRKAISVSFTPALRRRCQEALVELHTIADKQRQPAPVSNRRRCADCEFRRFCNDVL